MLPEEKLNTIDFRCQFYGFWLILKSFNLCQAIEVGPKKDETNKNVHDDDVLKYIISSK